MEEIIFLVEDSPEGGFTAKALDNSIFTEADTLDELRDKIKDAIACHFDEQKPRLVRLHVVKDYVFAA
jgi:predicted RNase H-like HicB family nuclease